MPAAIPRIRPGSRRRPKRARSIWRSSRTGMAAAGFTPAARARRIRKGRLTTVKTVIAANADRMAPAELPQPVGRPATEQKQAVADPVRHGSKRETDQDQSDRRERVEEADDVIRKT